MSSTPSKKIKLKSSDGETFEVDETAVLISQTIKHMIEDGCADSVIPVPNVTSEILRKVIEYCNKHAEDKVSEEDLEVFDAEYVQVDQKTLFEIILAANYLTIPCLLKLGCQTVANMARGKTVQEIRNHFNIINDLTPEEEEQIRLENAWAFDHATQEEKTQGEQTQEEQTQEEQAEQA